MRILFKHDQQKLEQNILNIFRAIQYRDDMMMLEATGDIFDIAYAIGGMPFVASMNDKMHIDAKAAMDELKKMQQGERGNEDE